VDHFLSQFKNKKIIIFGTGNSASEINDELWFADVYCFVDNNETRWGTTFKRKVIYDPKILLLENKKEIKIIVASMYYGEISSQLLSMGFSEDIDFFNSNEVLFYLRGKQKYPAGHYYSVVPDLQNAVMNASAILNPENINQMNIHDIDLNTHRQIDLLKNFIENYYDSQPFGLKGEYEKNRYYFENHLFEYGDAITLYCMIRYIKPNRIIEVGSGFSSAVMLDTNEKFFENNIDIKFIEPYPERLNSLLTDKDKKASTILSDQVQEIEISIFDELDCGDILFIDSTHVSRIGSDVNFIIFEILPRLKPGVIIHFHDMFFPFTYPVEWFREGRFWNEAYLLRAFLQNNNSYSIRFWGNYLYHYFENISKTENLLFDGLPLFKNNIGGSLWLEKTNSNL